jgi:hypothetical protein
VLPECVKPNKARFIISEQTSDEDRGESCMEMGSLMMDGMWMRAKPFLAKGDGTKRIKHFAMVS